MTLLHALEVKLTNIIQYLIGSYLQFLKWGASVYLDPPIAIDYALIVIFVLYIIYFAIDYYKKKYKN